MPRPIDMHDSVWIEDLTMLEVRDLIKSGKTTALVLTGGIEENGPYLTTGKHNNVLKATGESIARSLGNALVAPIVTLEPGNPLRPNISPGTIVLSQATFQAVLTDMANSLRSQGFKDVVMVGDSGGNAKGMQAAATSLNAEWKGQGYVHFIPEYYNYADVEKFEEEKLGIHEKLEGYHDDYYITAIISTVSTDAIRMKERRKAGKFVINGVPLDPIAKTIENGKKMVAFRTEATVAAIKKSMAAKEVRRLRSEKSKNCRRSASSFLLLVSAFLASLAGAQTFPKADRPRQRLRQRDRCRPPRPSIDRRLDQLEQQTSSEIAVATVESLDGMSVEEYANRLFKEWGVGQAKQDNGVLVLVAPNEREMRIEVGYGLEGVLPDGLAGQVIRDDFTPRFRENDYSGGIRNGVNAPRRHRREAPGPDARGAREIQRRRGRHAAVPGSSFRSSACS